MNPLPSTAEQEAAELAPLLRARGWRLASAESCTGGLIAAACTAHTGSSEWFERGFVTYSNAAKVELLDVPEELLQAHGAVSEPVARAMAQGALHRAPVDAALAVTGIAGPGGAVPGKPVGTVWLALALRRPAGPAGPTVISECLQLPGGRDQVRQQTATIAIRRLRELLAMPSTR